jgi:methylated-DNA-[protein]-cysteine S-methyltransferase
MGQRMTDHRFFTEQFATPTGPMLLVTDAQDHVRALDWEDHTPRLLELLRRQYGTVKLEPKAAISPARQALEAYFDGKLTAILDVPVETAGTEFQREVWAALRTIPTGQTTSYGRLAAKLGRPKAMRAVGMANGSNSVSIIIPCHRVIGADQSLTGYGGGVERKRWLLRHEGALFAG